ncbi:MAG: hypothetical protein NVSMB19_06740 [Vulcanimicrobiaceae bacterium]
MTAGSWYDVFSAQLDRLEADVDRGESIDVVLEAWSGVCATAAAAVEDSVAAAPCRTGSAGRAN